MTSFSKFVDQALELPIAPSFTRIGYDVRRRVVGWEQQLPDLSGKVMVLTGATSGLGKAAAERLRAAGATVIGVGRSDSADMVADVGDYDQVRALAARVLSEYDRLDVLIHNAGALSAERAEAPDGTEATVASQVVGPFLLTELLLDRLAESAPARVITMSSGGMYSSPLRIDGLEMTATNYNGTEQYARAKRAQVTLNAEWARRFGDRGVFFHAMHPGWADTPGVADALPGFAKVVGPLLRTPEQGADTLVWLASADEPLQENGLFWHDRRPRRLHRLPSTTKSDTPERRSALWGWVSERARQR